MIQDFKWQRSEHTFLKKKEMLADLPIEGSSASQETPWHYASSCCALKSHDNKTISSHEL